MKERTSDVSSYIKLLLFHLSTSKQVMASYFTAVTQMKHLSYVRSSPPSLPTNAYGAGYLCNIRYGMVPKRIYAAPLPEFRLTEKLS